MVWSVVWCGGVVNVCDVVQTLVPTPGVRMLSKVASQGVGTLERSWMANTPTIRGERPTALATIQEIRVIG